MRLSVYWGCGHRTWPEFKMADYSNFVSQRQINAEKQQRRKAREEILRQVSHNVLISSN